MRWQERLTILCEERRLEGLDDGSEADHLTCLQSTKKPLINPSMSRYALSLVWAIRWVYLAVVRMERWPRIFCTSSRSTPASIKWVA